MITLIDGQLLGLYFNIRKLSLEKILQPKARREGTLLLSKHPITIDCRQGGTEDSEQTRILCERSVQDTSEVDFKGWVDLTVTVSSKLRRPQAYNEIVFDMIKL